jgi:hypothetical protein
MRWQPRADTPTPHSSLYSSYPNRFFAGVLFTGRAGCTPVGLFPLGGVFGFAATAGAVTALASTFPLLTLRCLLAICAKIGTFFVRLRCLRNARLGRWYCTGG